MDDNTIEIKLTKRGKDGWKKHLEETKGKKDAERFIDKIVDKYGADLFGFYQLIVKIDGGAGKNPEKGLTMIVNFKGKLGLIPTFTVSSPRVKQGDAK